MCNFAYVLKGSQVKCIKGRNKERKTQFPIERAHLLSYLGMGRYKMTGEMQEEAVTGACWVCRGLLDGERILWRTWVYLYGCLSLEKKMTSTAA